MRVCAFRPSAVQDESTAPPQGADRAAAVLFKTAERCESVGREVEMRELAMRFRMKQHPGRGPLVLRAVVVGDAREDGRLAETERLAANALRRAAHERSTDVLKALQVFTLKYEKELGQLAERYMPLFLKALYRGLAVPLGTTDFRKIVLGLLQPFADRGVDGLFGGNREVQKRVNFIAQVRVALVAAAHNLQRTDFTALVRQTGLAEALWKKTVDEPEWKAVVEREAPRAVGLEGVRDEAVHVLGSLIAEYDKLTSENRHVRYLTQKGYRLKPALEEELQATALRKARALFEVK